MKKKISKPVSKDKAFKNYSKRELLKLVIYWIVSSAILGILYYLIIEVLGKGQMPDYIVEPIVFLMISALLFIISIVGFKDLHDKDMV